MKFKHIKAAIVLTVVTIISCLSCSAVYGYSQELSMEELIKTEQELVERNEELTKENKRLHNMIGQYSILVRSLRSENEVLKNSVETIEDIEENRKYLGVYTLTYYCKEPDCGICGGGGMTASGTEVTPGRSVAVDPQVIPLGTKLYIDGTGNRIAEDTGSAVKGNKIDVNIETHAEALKLGKKYNVKVWIVE